MSIRVDTINDGFAEFEQDNAYSKDAIVFNPVNGIHYIANDDVPKGTVFTEGTTGATWRKSQSQIRSIYDDAAGNGSSEIWVENGELFFDAAR